MTGRAQIAGLVVAGLVVAGAGAGYYGLQRQKQRLAMLAALDHALLQDRQALRKRQEVMLRGDLSPLARVKAIPLKDGDYALGKEPLALDGVSDDEGAVKLGVGGGKVHLKAPAPVTVNGSPATERDLNVGDLIILQRLRLILSGMGPERTLVVYDPQNPARSTFPGPAFYPFNSEYTFQAGFQPAPRGQAGGKPILYEALRDGPHEVQVAGTISLTMGGRGYQLAAYRDGMSPLLLLPFRDPAGGPTGRYLYVPQPRSGEPLRIDFNQAWYPSCAYSKLYVCPPVPASNSLLTAIPAGEMTPHVGG